MKQILIPLLFSVLFGCSNNGVSFVSSQSTVTNTFSSASFNSAARDNEILTIIHGNPLSVDQGIFDTRITEAFEGAYSGQPAVFSTSAKPEKYDNARIVVQFSPPRSTNSTTICGSPTSLDPSIKEQQGELHAYAAFCIRDKVAVWARIKGPMPNSINDPVLIQMAKAIIRSVVPKRKNVDLPNLN